MSTRRLPKSKQIPEGPRGHGFTSQPNTLPELSAPQLYRPESSMSSSVDRWTHTEQDHVHYPARQVDFSNANVQPQVVPQWRPPRRSHYPYTPQHQLPPPLAPTSQPQPTPQHTLHEQPTVATHYSWPQQSSGVSSQFNSTSYSTVNRPQSHSYQGHHPHAYEPSSAPTYQPRPQPSQTPQPHSAQSAAAPSELTELGLVTQESRLDERWTSFMRDSGYFEGFGYRGR